MNSFRISLEFQLYFFKILAGRTLFEMGGPRRPGEPPTGRANPRPAGRTPITPGVGGADQMAFCSVKDQMALGVLLRLRRAVFSIVSRVKTPERLNNAQTRRETSNAFKYEFPPLLGHRVPSAFWPCKVGFPLTIFCWSNIKFCISS